jgi:hypothetical protein
MESYIFDGFSVLRLCNLTNRFSKTMISISDNQAYTLIPHHPQAALPINPGSQTNSLLGCQEERNKPAKEVGINTSVLGKPVLLQFLIKQIPFSDSRNMIPIPEDVTHRNPDTKGNADIKEDLTTKFAGDGGQIADLVGAWCPRWRRILGPIDLVILQRINI